jgi:hypothetical protein
LSTFKQLRNHFDGRFAPGFITICIGFVTMENSFLYRRLSMSEMHILPPRHAELGRLLPQGAKPAIQNPMSGKQNMLDTLPSQKEELLFPARHELIFAFEILHKDPFTGWISLVATCARFSTL